MLLHSMCAVIQLCKVESGLYSLVFQASSIDGRWCSSVSSKSYVSLPTDIARSY